jgi:hypothetical protein
MSGNINTTISNYTPTQGFFSVLSKYLVLDTIVDPIFLSRNYFLQSQINLEKRKIKIKNKEEELNSTQALIRFWEESFGLEIPNRWFSDSDKNQKKLIELPRNTLIGRRINLANESPQSASKSEFLLPFFSSHLSLPCKPGEVVWVFKQSNMAEHQKYAWWVSKVVEPGHSDDVNFLPPERNLKSETNFYMYGNGRTKKDGSPEPRSMKFVTDDPQLVEKIALNTPGGKQTIKEAVPRFKKRPGDLVLEGSNNTLIVLGTDRESSAFNSGKLEKLSLDLCQNIFERGSQTSTLIAYEDKILPDEDIKTNAGSIDLVAGRKKLGEVNKVISTNPFDESQKNLEISQEVTKDIQKYDPAEGDPDLVRDSSRILISQKSKIDKKIKLEGYNKNNQDINISDSEDGDPSILLKSDKIRVVGRKDVQIIVKNDEGEDITSVSAKSDGSITVKSKNNFTLKIDKDGKVNLDSKGDIVINPGPGMIKLGGEDANNSILCQEKGKTIVGGMGTTFGTGASFGIFSSKVLVK